MRQIIGTIMSKSRFLSIDLIKVIAMLGVMCLHAEMSYYENPLAQCLYMSAVVSIPLFFMVSGYLLYGKETTDIRYSAKKIWGILRFAFIIATFFWLLSGVRHGESYLHYTMGGFLQMGQFGLFWYFGAMMILYALLPLTHRLYQNHPKLFLALTVALGVLSNVIFIANFFDVHIENRTIQTFRMWNWLFYFNLGGIVRRSVCRSSVGLVGLLLVTNYLFQLYLTPLMPTKFCEYFYCSLPVMLLVFFLFSYVVKLDEGKIGWVWGG